MNHARSSAAVAKPAKYLPRKILVADDDDGVRAGLVANLELEGYQVFEARDGAEAVELLSAHTYDLIVSDVVMPAATGVEVLCAVRKRHLDTPFILISAFVSEDLVSRALGEGLFAMLYKPFAMERILGVVARALKRNVVLLVASAHSHIASLAPTLRSVGILVEVREDGPSALEFARANRVDVCVLDLALESEEGLRTCEALRATDERMDIISISGAANSKPMHGAASHGIATSLREPFEVRELLAAIARVRAATPVKK